MKKIMIIAFFVVLLFPLAYSQGEAQKPEWAKTFGTVANGTNTYLKCFSVYATSLEEARLELELKEKANEERQLGHPITWHEEQVYGEVVGSGVYYFF